MQQREIRFLDKLFIANKEKVEPVFDDIDKSTLSYRWYSAYKSAEETMSDPFYILIEEVCGAGIGAPQKPWSFRKEDNLSNDSKSELSRSFAFFSKEETKLTNSISGKTYDNLETGDTYPAEERKYAEFMLLGEVLRRLSYLPEKDKYKFEYYECTIRTKDVRDTVGVVWSISIQRLYNKGGIEFLFDLVSPLFPEFREVDSALDYVAEKYKAIIESKTGNWERRGKVKR